MANSYSRSPRLIKGALVEFSERFIGPIPNIIVFQYNPETMSRTLEVWSPESANGAGGEGGDSSAAAGGAATAQPSDPPETFTLSLELDAADALEEPGRNPVTVVSGVANRIAALEMLLYPQEGSLLGGLLGDVGSALGGAVAGIAGALGGGAEPVPRGTVPVLLFVWGPGRIVPVRLTGFSVEEQAFSPTLYPIRAKVNVELKILTPSDFPASSSGSRKLSEELAIAAFNYTRKQKQTLAASNIANNVDAILGMLPF